MERHSTFRTTVLLLSTALLGAELSSVPSPVRGATILETATLGANPVARQGIGGIQYVGARFTVAQPVIVDHIGVNLAGSSTIFGAIVPLSGPGGLPANPPSQIESYALAGTTFTAPPA